ncbi:MAG TPA: hypothetical protein VGO62_12195, partial [Myxococcota bacterium]
KTEQKQKAKDTTDENKPEHSSAPSGNAGATQIVDRGARGAREMTMRVTRAPRVRDVTAAAVDDRTDLAVEPPRNTAGRIFLAAAAAFAVVAIVGSIYLARGTDPPTPPVVAERPHDATPPPLATPPTPPAHVEIAPAPSKLVEVAPAKVEPRPKSDVDIEPLAGMAAATPAAKQRHDPKKTPSARADKGTEVKHTPAAIAAVVDTATPAPVAPAVDDKPQITVQTAVKIAASKSCPPCKEKSNSYNMAAALNHDDAKTLLLGREILTCVVDNKCH